MVARVSIFLFFFSNMYVLYFEFNSFTQVKIARSTYIASMKVASSDVAIAKAIPEFLYMSIISNIKY